MRRYSPQLIPSLLLMALLLLLLNACQTRPAGPTPEGPHSIVQSSPIKPSPSLTPPVLLTPKPVATVDKKRNPGPGITASAVTADGSFWYAFDAFDALGGSVPGSHQGLYRLLAGQVTHFDIPGTIRILAVAPDDTLYIGSGCGVMSFQAGRIETLLAVACDDPDRLNGLIPIDFAFGNDGLVWVGGVHILASYDGQVWQEYDLPARRVAIDLDGSIWTQGWDGRGSFDCCLTQLSASGPVTYTWSGEGQAPPEVMIELFGPARP